MRRPHAFSARFSALGAFCASAFLALSAQWPGLANPYVVNGDVRQQLFWMRRWLDPALYPPDLLSEYARHYVSWGVRGLYRLAALTGLDPLFFSKLVAVALLIWLGMLFFALARRLAGEAAAWTTLAVYGLMPAFAHYISGGLARAFALPLLALFLLALLRGSRPLAWGALLAQALFIPYILPICLGLAGLWWAGWRVGLVRTKPLLGVGRMLWLDLACALLAMGLVLAWKSGLAPYGPAPWGSDMAARPELGPHGRLAILPVPSLLWELVVRPWERIAPFRDGNPWLGAAVTAVLLPLAALGLRRLGLGRLGLGRPDRADPRTALPLLGCLLLASLLLWIAARVLFLQLFLPSRYMEYSLVLLYCLGLGLALAAVVPSAVRAAVRSAVRSATGGQGSGRAVLALLLGCALLLGAWRVHGEALYDYSGDAALYQAVRQTPKESLFAGHPRLMDNVLTFGQRDVYISFELVHPWSGAYWEACRQRLEGLLRAYYAPDADELIRFCVGQGIDFLVVDRRHFTPEFLAGRPFFEPFDALIREVAASGRFAALDQNLPSQRIDANISIVDMRKAGAAGGSFAPDASPGIGETP